MSSDGNAWQKTQRIRAEAEMDNLPKSSASESGRLPNTFHNMN